MARKKKDRYAEAGVDIDAGNRFVQRIQSMVGSTFRRGVITDIGGFAGLFSLNLKRFKKPVLLASTDGVGTKLKVAFLMDKHDTVGIDLVAMSVNDIMVQGATPLFMLDYFATGKLHVDKAVEVMKGIVAGCREAECSLIGGETAEMPDFYAEGEYDLAGFAVGVADQSDLIDGSEIAVGDQVIGIASSGLHSNGYSLARRIFFDELKMSVMEYVKDFGRTLGEELLAPTKIYVKTIKKIMRGFRIHGMAHITGGGLLENVPRILPKQCKVVIHTSTWTPPPIFRYLRKAGNLSTTEMLRTFNIGIGLVMVVRKQDAARILSRLKNIGEVAYLIGSVESRKTKSQAIQFTA